MHLRPEIQPVLDDASGPGFVCVERCGNGVIAACTGGLFLADRCGSDSPY